MSQTTPTKQVGQELRSDPPINSQQWSGIAFLSPENAHEVKINAAVKSYLIDDNSRLSVLKASLATQVDVYLSNKIREVSNSFTEPKDLRHVELCPNVIKECRVDISALVDNPVEYTQEDVNSIMDDISIFQSQNYEELEHSFESISEGMLTSKGIKVRGLYNTVPAVMERVKYLTEKVEPGISVMVVPNGTWTPWMPYRETQDHLTDDEGKYILHWMNNFMREYIAIDQTKKNLYLKRVEQDVAKTQTRAQRRKRDQYKKQYGIEDAEEKEEDEEGGVEETKHPDLALTLEDVLKDFPVNKDYLEEDNVINGQRYGCISLISPSKELTDTKYTYLVSAFVHHKTNTLTESILSYMARIINNKITSCFDCLLSSIIDETVDVDVEEAEDTEVDEEKAAQLKENEDLREFLFRFRDQLLLSEEQDVLEILSNNLVNIGDSNVKFSQALGEFMEANKSNPDYFDMEQTDPRLYAITGGEIHMVKLRGAFNDHVEAEKWCTTHRDEKEPHINSITLSIGGWAPFNPNVNSIDADHANSKLNDAMQKYQDNVHIRNSFKRQQFSRDQAVMAAPNASVRDRLRKKLIKKNRDKIKHQFSQFKR